MHRAEKAFWVPAPDRRRSRQGRTRRRNAAAIVAGAVTALAGTACTAATSGTGAACHAPPSGAAHHAPPVKVLTQAADAGNGDIFIAQQRCGYKSRHEAATNTGKVIWFH